MIRTAPKICAGRFEAGGREIRQAIETAILLERARVTWAAWEAFAGGEAEFFPVHWRRFCHGAAASWLATARGPD